MLLGLVIGAAIAMTCGLGSTALEIKNRRKVWQILEKFFYITAMMCGIAVGIVSYLK